MAIETPTRAEVVARMQTDVSREVPGSNPRLRGSWIWGVVVGCGRRVYAFYYYLTRVSLMFFPDTATGAWARRWGAIWGQTLNAATRATGIVVFNASNSEYLAVTDNQASTSDGKVYQQWGVAARTGNVMTVTITSVGTLATATTTAGDHGLSSDVSVLIANANQGAYNGTFTITVTAADEFQYTMASDPVSPATGTITATWAILTFPCRSVLTGADQNQVADTQLTLGSPVPDVDSIGRVTLDALAGGADQETDPALKVRYLFAIRNPISQFNVAAIVLAAKSITGVTRVWVREATPATGQVTVHFMRDLDDDNGIPTGSELTDVDGAVQAIRPANTDPTDVIIAAPEAVPSVYTFDALSPNTATMQAAIEANLEQFYREETEVDDGVVVEGDIPEEAYVATIYNTIDPVTGETVQSFTLSAPAGDITVTAGKIGTLSTVTFP